MKTFFIVPGFKQGPKSKSFQWLKVYLTKKGFRVVIVPITWDRKVMSDHVAELVSAYAKEKSNVNYILGFSYGAVATFVAANELKPKKIFLCSLSPDFKEDLTVMKPWILRYIGKNRVADLKNRSGREIAKALKVPSILFYGSVEGKQYPQLIKRSEETVKLARNSKLVVVKGAPHAIDHLEYQKVLKAELSRI